MSRSGARLQAMIVAFSLHHSVALRVSGQMLLSSQASQANALRKALLYALLDNFRTPAD
jgi:hypothetical protein